MLLSVSINLITSAVGTYVFAAFSCIPGSTYFAMYILEAFIIYDSTIALFSITISASDISNVTVFPWIFFISFFAITIKSCPSGNVILIST